MSRKIKNRTTGHNKGLITRLINPADQGQLTKPFVFLDYINGLPPKNTGFGWHPHSGIATFTYYVEGGTDIQESTGNQVSLGVRDIEYLQAGNGVWHKGQIRSDQYAKGFQLWIALPPDLQAQTPSSTFLKNEEIPEDNGVYLLLGDYNGRKSKIEPPYHLNYLEVNLKKNQDWEYTVPNEHDVLFIFLYEGDLSGDAHSQTAELIIFENGNQPLKLSTKEGAKFLLGSAKSFDYELVMSGSSVHTSQENLLTSLKRINEIKNELFD